jgi:ribonuclease PH
VTEAAQGEPDASRIARPDGRGARDLRPVRYETGYLEWAEGSVLLEVGKTRVLCAASHEAGVPRFLLGAGTGWVTAEYSMLPRSTQVRTPREISKGRPSGRTQEIQRLIGRSLRAVTNLGALGENTIWVDCDVLQADGGTRTASITAGYMALALAVRALKERGVVEGDALADSVAAVSVGIVEGVPLLDLCYEEDARAEVDFNVVMTGSGKLVEVQGTAEGAPFSRDDLDTMLSLAAEGIDRLTTVQREVAGG